MLASSTDRDIINFANMDDQKKGAFETIEAVIGIRSRIMTSHLLQRHLQKRDSK